MISSVGSRAATVVEPKDDVQIQATTDTSATVADPKTSTATTSTFDADPAKATTTAVPAEVDAARSTELTSLTGSPATQKSADVVQPQTQVTTIVQAAKPEERDAVRAHFDNAPAEERAKAFEEVLKASTTQGTRPVVLGPFTGSVTVDAKGDVNGAPLASDAEVKAGAQLANLTNDDRKAELRQVGVDERWLGAASEAQVLTAFNQVELGRQFGTPGAASVQLPELRQQMGRGMLTIPASTTSYSVTADRQLTNAAGVTAPAASQAALTRIAETEGAEWPGGTPESRLKTRIEDTTLAIPASEKLATVTSVLPEAEAAKFAQLVNTPPGVSAGSLETAYQTVLDARKTPGAKNLDLQLTPLETQESYSGGESGSMTVTTVEKPPVTFSTTLSVSEDGKVNGKTLGVDELARLSSQISTVPAEAKEAALKEAGLSEGWIGAATQEQKDYALAKLRQATGSPGEKTLDLSFSVTTTGGGESEYVIHNEYPAQLKLNVGADGKVDGKTPSIEVALATTLTMEKMSMVEKRLMLSQLGIPSEGLRTATAQEASDLLTRVALRTRTPGDQQFEAKLGGKDYIVGLKVGEKGELKGVGAMLKPEPPKQKWYQKWLGPILTIASFVFPVAAPFLQAANAALAIKNGAKGLGLIAAVAGGVAGVGGMIGQLSTAGSQLASTAASVARVAGDVASLAGVANGVHQGIKHGDFLGAFSSVVSLAGNFSGVRDAFGSSFDMIKTAGTVAGYASRVVNGDVAGLITDVAGQVNHSVRTSELTGTQTATQSDVRRIDNAIDAAGTEAGSATDFSLGGSARFGDSGTSTVRLGGDSTVGTDETTTGATQADVRRIDNEIFGTVVRVSAGDNLTKIATASFGDAALAPEIYAWNAAKIGNDPNLIRAGVDLEMPPADFRLSEQERNAFYRTTHIPPPAVIPTVTQGGGTVPGTTVQPGTGTTPVTTPATTPATTPVTSGGTLGLNTMSHEWGNSDPSIGAYNGTDTLAPGSMPSLLAGAKLKFELQMGTFRGEVAVGPEVGVSAKIANDGLSTRDVKLRAGPFQFVGEPSISVQADGTFSVEGKVQAAAGPVSVNLKGVIDQNGNYKLDVPTVGYRTDWLGVGAKVGPVGVALSFETGGLFRWVGSNPNAPTSPFFNGDGGIAP